MFKTCDTSSDCVTLHTTIYHNQEDNVAYFQPVFGYIYKKNIQLSLAYGVACIAAAKLIMANFDSINTRGINLAKYLNLHTVHEMKACFTTKLIFKAIHGIAPNNLCHRIYMNFDILGYDTRETGSMNAHPLTVHKEVYKNSFP